MGTLTHHVTAGEQEESYTLFNIHDLGISLFMYTIISSQ